MRLYARLSRQAASNGPTSSEGSTNSDPPEASEGERQTLAARSMRLEPTPDDAKMSKRHGLKNIAAYMVDRVVRINRACHAAAAAAPTDEPC